MADHGSIIIIGKEDEPIDYVEYSIDEGETWKTIGFGNDEKIELSSIVTEPSNTGSKFLVYGETTISTGDKKGVVISIDFSQIFDNVCKTEDYEVWTPHSKINSNCILGVKT